MARPTVDETAELLEKLARLLASKPPALFRRVGGEVALVIVGHEPPDWCVRLDAQGVVELTPGLAAGPIVKIGLKPSALGWLVAGTLDVERAFREKRLAVEGDLRALERFAQCFAPAGSLVGVRSS
jgi:hypothetical protein